ncbi:MAG TPA: hypothetical protein VJM75_00580 [Acidimicrobiales bacterium]|nr:hypothetical protein [Acidimicrobiales bacterium]
MAAALAASALAGCSDDAPVDSPDGASDAGEAHEPEPVAPEVQSPITAVASGGAGPDGNYSYEAPVEQIRPWVEAAGTAASTSCSTSSRGAPTS